MLLITYYAQNYASIICQGLVMAVSIYMVFAYVCNMIYKSLNHFLKLVPHKVFPSRASNSLRTKLARAFHSSSVTSSNFMDNQLGSVEDDEDGSLFAGLSSGGAVSPASPQESRGC